MSNTNSPAYNMPVGNNNSNIVRTFFNLCLTLPNIGLFVFYLIFILIVPLMLIGLKKSNLITIYLPLLVPIAIVISESGGNKVRQLYPLKSNETELIGKISKLLLNFMAICGIMWIAVSNGINKNNLVYGVLSGIVTITVVFLISPEFIPIVIREGDKYLEKKGAKMKHNIHKYGIGLLFIIILYVFDIVFTEVSYRSLSN
jgi:hypothetical protein